MNRSQLIATLRARVSAIEGAGLACAQLTFGVAEIDARLPSGGLSCGALHEFAATPNLADDAAATIFIAGLLARADGHVIWCVRWCDLFAPSLYLAGLHPDRVIFVECGDDKGVLTAMEESLRHEGLAGVVGELRHLPQIASKRLQLLAEKSKVPAFAFRRWAKARDAQGGSASVTRWKITAAPSEALGVGIIGRPRWHVALERARGGESHSWIVEACDAQGRIALSSEFADRPASAEERQAAA